MAVRTAMVTGAFSYTGSAVARSLLDRGFEVRTLTNRKSPVHDPGPVAETHPLQSLLHRAFSEGGIGAPSEVLEQVAAS